jgi:Uma2 family endonuclease
MGPLAEKLKERYTYGEYLTWDDGERWELIDGVPYNMTPAPSRRHQLIAVELTRQFATFLLDKPCQVYAAPFDVRLPEAGEAEAEITTVVQPDISVICDPLKLDDAGCIGAPDLVVEILSPSTSLRDHREKFNRYERAGVQEYWLVDPANRLVTVFTLGPDKKYGRAGVYGGEDRISVRTLPGLEVELPPVFRDIS